MGDGRMGLPEVLLSGLEKAIGIHQAAVTSYVARLRRARPDATPAEIIAALEKWYLAAVTGTGAAVGGAAAAPGVGTVAALALSSGEAAVFLETTALFALVVAEVHGIRVDEVERRRTLVLAVVLGDRGAMMIEKLTRQTDQRWAELLPDTIPLSSITAINRTLGRWFVTKFERKLGALAIGKCAPFGVGAAIGASGNRAFGRQVVNASRRVFGSPPARFADHGIVTIIDGTVG